MRAIKFRGLTPDGKWAYGLPYYDYAEACFFITHGNGWTPTYLNPDEGEGNIFQEIDPQTIGQFIGLNDINGTEVYEGDILKDENNIPCVMTYVGNKFLATYRKNGGLFNAICGTSKVVGNIYETPELI